MDTDACLPGASTVRIKLMPWIRIFHLVTQAMTICPSTASLICVRICTAQQWAEWTGSAVFDRPLSRFPWQVSQEELGSVWPVVTNSRHLLSPVITEAWNKGNVIQYVLYFFGILGSECGLCQPSAPSQSLAMVLSFYSQSGRMLGANPSQEWIWRAIGAYGQF